MADNSGPTRDTSCVQENDDNSGLCSIHLWRDSRSAPRSEQVRIFFIVFTGFDSIVELAKDDTREWTDNSAVLPSG